jgi:hypothetical protein
MEKDHGNGRGAADEQGARAVLKRDHQLVTVLGEGDPQNSTCQGSLKITGHEGHDMV